MEGRAQIQNSVHVRTVLTLVVDVVGKVPPVSLTETRGLALAADCNVRNVAFRLDC